MNQDKIWDVYQNDESIQQFGCPDGGRIEFISKKCPPNKKILNIGVGKGRLEKLCAEKGVNIFSLDPSKETIKRISEELGLKEKAQVGYSQEIPFPDDFFDFVVMTEVLEHLSTETLLKTISEVYRVLKKGGTFIGTVPADENLQHGNVVCPCCGEIFHRWGHQQSFSEGKITQTLNNKFLETKISRLFFHDHKNLNWKGKAIVIPKTIQAKLNIPGSNQNFYFRCRK
ncbi:bifunctional 2-polyprenyl-6-hydroxyphenol methylase/3-demethylubiquinol 3-O-methyltransferase UbiG [Thalassospira sp. MCCC 1A01428]|jgi:SAM-dependent methyltransferase|uniref:class I SAM-dependent methyltransferase n=1 Tax=Thalassospira sp. MCCC 1A01428 TaxID=1470575 RepID=UPI000A1F32FF|nr:class I SAM-dependent methyltransferase [Thalassospira sp. MCCC 1A01428]OSQ41767.1 hypothetical protein THS27_17430 [Thalassospira sp. MCCC 1A01428]